ncbi:MAG: phosphopyruvate hydratase [Candidatus Levybacteria bacterium RIFCSPHIGHO2_12_FULL_38_12]|nr:MAG: phosphopyruvate hydratase [Candidatus Levybacteria bacterium RIFCSPHIGHO2_01_FULL_38_12]OGH22454.1 MAG: phosphopyruvate hydratase [Candidatus Levybacteria bacterium RIFCSPHIGHO2_12_FULL_38_12]OGH44363.1 MAG: phosphopyruvate hydratase [Candidatus Levybacteria bacterium RIFCSPLOWO2_02_FULL_37_18]
MAIIKQIHAREILNSKGNPAIETTVVLSDGASATASCPSGTSVGTYEAVDLKDNDSKRFKGLGVLKAVDHVKNSIAPKLVGMEASNQADTDNVMIELDGTKNKSKLGANATLSVSMAVCKASAKSHQIPLFMYIRQFSSQADPLKTPTPLFNLINGGKHASSNLDFQEFFLIPATSKTYEECILIGFNVTKALSEILVDNNLNTLVGDEGGFGPKLSKNSEALQLLKDAVDRESIRFGFDVFFGIDAASNSFFNKKNYRLKDRSSPYSAEDLINYYKDINNAYHLLYLEDPFAEDDWSNWAYLSEQISNTIIVGDDLTVTNPFRLQTALDKKAIGGVIVKPNQIGTVIETLAVVEIAKSEGLKIIVSHRSGETNEDFIADFAVGVSSDYVKFGALQRGERMAKYNRLLYINEQLKSVQKST